MRSVSFDVDGTLISTQELNRRAYAEVGVRVPDHAWGERWQDWLTNVVGDYGTAVVLHARKTFIYADMVRDCDVSTIELPAGRVARELSHGLHGDVAVHLLTGGAQHSTEQVLRRLDIHAVAVHTNLDHVARVARLAQLPPGTLYVDNLATTVEKLLTQVPYIRSIHYVDQTYDEILTEALYEPSTEATL